MSSTAAAATKLTTAKNINEKLWVESMVICLFKIGECELAFDFETFYICTALTLSLFVDNDCQFVNNWAQTLGNSNCKNVVQWVDYMDAAMETCHVILFELPH